MQESPLKVRLAVRDLWDPITVPALQRLKQCVGSETRIDPEWGMLHAALGGMYKDDMLFVKQTADLVAAWADAACAVCDIGDYGDKLVDKLDGTQLRLFLDVSADKNPALEWSKQRGGFVLSIPRDVRGPGYNWVEFLEGAMRACLDLPPPAGVPPATHTSELTASLAVISKEADGWEDVHVTARAPARKPQFFPTVASLPRPDDLLRQPPYHLLMHASGSNVLVECSHSPTLQLLSDYLKQWCRANHNRTDKPPLVEIKLHQSPFALGQTYDRLQLQGGKQLHDVLPTPTIILSIVEGLLGYELVQSTASSWAYRRTEAFRTA